MKTAVVLLCLALYGVAARNTDSVRSTTEQNGDQVFGIQGGRTVSIEKHPYTVAIYENRGYYLGTGVLIEDQWILTAALAVYGWPIENLQFKIGSTNAEHDGETVLGEKRVVHPEYIKTWDNDLALVKLAKPIKPSPKTKSIPIGTTLPKAGEHAEAVGYGSTERESFRSDYNLRDVSVPFIPSRTCAKHYESQPKLGFSDHHFCASTGGESACALDWGSPLVYKNHVIGIFAGSNEGCGTDDYPAAYVDVTKYTEWIRKTIKS